MTSSLTHIGSESNQRPHRFSCRDLIMPGHHWIWISMILYVLACMLPAMPPIFGNNKITGFSCLISFMYMLPAWWANPCYFVALGLVWFRYGRASTVLSVIATALAFSFELSDFPNPGWQNQILDQEIGCYMWVMSMQVLACERLWQQWLEWRRRQTFGPDAETNAI